MMMLVMMVAMSTQMNRCRMLWHVRGIWLSGHCSGSPSLVGNFVAPSVFLMFRSSGLFDEVRFGFGGSACMACSACWVKPQRIPHY